MKSIVWDNPLPPHSGPKGKKMAKKRKKGRKSSSAPKSHTKKRRHKKSNPSGGKKHRKRRGKRRNPGMLGSLTSGAGGMSGTVKKGVGLALGILGAQIVGQNLVPSRFRTGVVGSVAQAGVGLAAGFVMKKVAALRPYADAVAAGGIAAAILSQAQPIVLPALQLNLLGAFDRRFLGAHDTRVISMAPTGPTVTRHNGARLPA